MQNSTVLTVSVPAIGSPNPGRIVQAGNIPMRVVVRNNGGNLVYIAHDTQDVAQKNSTGGTYGLPAGQSDVFVLAPKQSLFAAAMGGGGSLSLAISEAIPVGKAYMES